MMMPICNFHLSRTLSSLDPHLPRHWESTTGKPHLQGPLRVAAEQNHSPSDCRALHTMQVDCVNAEPSPSMVPSKLPAQKEQNK